MDVNNVFDHGMAVPWSDLRKFYSFLGLWGGGRLSSDQILNNDYTAKTLKQDFAQKARDARREIFQE
jgi:hypothetical protein